MATAKKDTSPATGEDNTEATEADATTSPATGEEMVPVRLFKDSEKYKDDVFVAVNGKAYKIQRGVTVKVPRCVYDVLMNSMDQDQATADLIKEESNRYKAEAAALNI